MQLEDFFDYKNQLMEDLLTNETIVHLIDDDMPMERAHELAYKQVFPYEYVPETAETSLTYVCFDVDVSRSSSVKPQYVLNIYLYVMAHASKMRLPEGGVRVDKLCSEIAKAINGSYDYGLGTLELQSTRRFAPMTDYQGKSIVFQAKEINRFKAKTHKAIPANRKQ